MNMRLMSMSSILSERRGKEDSVDVTEKKVSTTHRRKDMDLL
ncbi:MAG: hypothetical protein CM15mV9_1580 [uncultured marine virus]|nr:MAG: hypothetical protein CM15mV9_1580 [uncultured marine virus]